MSNDAAQLSPACLKWRYQGNVPHGLPRCFREIRRRYAHLQFLICPRHGGCEYAAHQGLHSIPKVSHENCPDFLTNLSLDVQLMECVRGPGKLKGKEGTRGWGAHENRTRLRLAAAEIRHLANSEGAQWKHLRGSRRHPISAWTTNY